jgi:hypothetical protein
MGRRVAATNLTPPPKSEPVDVIGICPCPAMTATTLVGGQADVSA